MDQRSLAVQYATSANLAARIELHRRCSTNAYGFQRWVFDQLGLASGRRVLEIGCGTGNLWRENADRLPRPMNLVLSDFSISMIETTSRVIAARFVNCALPDLPFRSGSLDLVIANHMLYHVADRARGFAEIRRVLARGGVLFAATNGESHLREIKELMRAFGIEATDFSSGFTIENGDAQMRSAFENFRRADYEDSLRITDPDLLLGYIASMSERARDVVAARGKEMRAAIEDRIAREGAFHVVKSTGAFVAVNE
ncbi:MAG TPA: class I SAM-dependent methyltransferase [Thermoanaerobaculia bacterium]|nr:class I SAM-dependent methyltransferase [Thermoanaerobaculia bacterium]